MPKMAGGCPCGAVRYESDAEPMLVAVCYCATCQRNSGSAFSLNLDMPADAVAITGESLTIYEDSSGASGKPFHRPFCARCGSPISSRGEAYDGLVFLKAGTIDDPSWVRPGIHIWCSEKQPWVAIDGAVTQVPGNPT